MRTPNICCRRQNERRRGYSANKIYFITYIRNLTDFPEVRSADLVRFSFSYFIGFLEHSCTSSKLGEPFWPSLCRCQCWMLISPFIIFFLAISPFSVSNLCINNIHLRKKAGAVAKRSGRRQALASTFIFSDTYAIFKASCVCIEPT